MSTAVFATRTSADVESLANEAFERLFTSEYRRVVAIAARVIGRRDLAEDVAQDVFVAYVRRYPHGVPFAAPWLHTAAAHAALNAIRGERRRRARESRDARLRDPLSGSGSLALDPAGIVQSRDDGALVRRILARLPRRHGAILALRYAGLSYAEVAAALGVKPNSVGTMLARAEAAFAKACTP